MWENKSGVKYLLNIWLHLAGKMVSNDIQVIQKNRLEK